MKNLIGIVFALALLLVSSTNAQERQLVREDLRSEKRVALVIGNSAYPTAPLKNPVSDAQDIAEALRGLGFDVIFSQNLNQNDMKRAIREFGTKIRNGGVGLFYYAGHGVAVKGVNYLVPVDAKIESEEEVEYECVDAGFVLAQMDGAGNRLNIVILDACRNNPFARSFRSASRGLTQMDAPSGTLIAYATAPGSIASDGNARNGLYTQELLKFVHTPNLGIEEVFKRVRISVRNLTQGRQTPWESSSLTGDFTFVRDKNTNQDMAQSQTATNIQKPSTEQSSTATSRNSPDDGLPSLPETMVFKGREFNSPEGKFSILMPSEPTPEVKDVETAVGTLKLHLFAVSTSSGYFLASYGDYPSAPADSNEAESVLDGVRDGIVNGSNSELVSETKFSFYSYPARELITKKTDQGAVIVFHWRVYLVGRRLYQLAVGTTQKDSEIPDIAKFLISFDLNKSATR